MAEDKDSKKHDASAQKKKEQRKKGNVPKSQDVGITVGLVSGFGALFVMHSFYLAHLRGVFQFCAEQLQYTDRIDIRKCVLFVAEQVLLLSLPVLAAVLVLGVAAQLGQVGLIFSGEQLKPKLEKINPLNGFKRWFSIKSMVELGKSLVKIVATFLVGGLVVWHAIPQIRQSVNLDVPALLAFGGHLVEKMFWQVLALFFVIAAIDFFFQRRQWAKDLKMTDQEVKDEYKQQEGDPYMKAQRRQVARQMAQQAAAGDAVPYSDAVIINPTQLAMAVKYDPAVSPVPYVVAKGEKRLADEIRHVANGAGVPVVRNQPLARALYETCEIGDVIPAELYKPVAEILAYVFSLKEDQSATAPAGAQQVHALPA